MDSVTNYTVWNVISVYYDPTGQNSLPKFWRTFI